MIGIMKLNTGIILELSIEMKMVMVDKLAEELKDTLIFKGIRVDSVISNDKTVGVVMRCSYIEDASIMDYITIITIISKYDVTRTIDSIHGVPYKEIIVYLDCNSKKKEMLITRYGEEIVIVFIDFRVEEAIIKAKGLYPDKKITDVSMLDKNTLKIELV